jgi:hypothetical protein
MRKLWLLIGALAGMALGLAACGARSTAAPAEATPTRLASTASPVAATQGLVMLSTTEPATCTVSSYKPTQGPTEESLFPGVSQADWRLGPDGARVVIIEYSDFQ